MKSHWKADVIILEFDTTIVANRCWDYNVPGNIWDRFFLVGFRNNALYFYNSALVGIVTDFTCFLSLSLLLRHDAFMLLCWLYVTLVRLLHIMV